MLAAYLAASGCHRSQRAESDAIRDGIRQYLGSLNTLNLSAMDMNVTNVKIDGAQARADVEFTAKTGGRPGTGMKISYSLEKHGDQWLVVKKNAIGGTIDHPTGNATLHTQPGEVHGNMPNFRELLPPPSGGTSASSDTLPPGHPPLNTPEKPKEN